MTNLVKWKLATGILAVTTVVSLHRSWRGKPTQRAAATRVAPGASPASQVAARRLLRIPASALGTSEAALVAELERTKDPHRAVVLIERLGFVGTDQSVRLLEKLTADPTPTIAVAAISSLGQIGTARATGVLLELVEQRLHRQRYSVVSALGRTGRSEAKQKLMAIARDVGEPERNTAVRALGEMGGRDVLALLREMVDRRDYQVISTVGYAAGLLGSDGRQLLLDMTRSTDAQVRTAALLNISSSGDPTVEAQLMEVLATADPYSAASAAAALGRSRSRTAVPLLIEMVRSGGQTVSVACIRALGSIGGQAATEALGKLLTGSSRTTAHEAALALATIGGDKARDLLIDAVDRGRGDRSAMLAALQRVGGPEVEAVMLEVARKGRATDRRTSLHYLLRRGNSDAIELAIELAKSGPRGQRAEIVNLLATTSSPRAREALLWMGEHGSGATRAAALDALGRHSAGDPKVSTLLVTAFGDAKGGRLHAIAASLARAKTPAARKALLDALGSSDPARASAAAAVISQLGNGDDVRKALVAAAGSDNRQVSQAALGQLLRSGSDEAYRLAGQALRSGDDNRARSTLWLLSSTVPTTPQAQELFVEAAGSSNRDVRLAAAQALRNSGDQSSSIQALATLSRDSDATVRSTAYYALGQIASPEAVDTLVGAARSGKVSDRRAAVSALANVNDARADDVIAELINDADPQVATTAIYAARNGGESVDRALTAIVLDDSASQEVRAAAAAQLRARGIDDDNVSQKVDALIGKRSYYGGYDYGGSVY